MKFLKSEGWLSFVRLLIVAAAIYAVLNLVSFQPTYRNAWEKPPDDYYFH